MLTNHKPLLLPAAFGLCLALMGDLPTAATPASFPPAPQQQPKSTSIGDVKITYAHIRANFRRSSTVLLLDAVIESRDARQPTQIRVLADQVNASQSAKNNDGIVDMTGHIRYTITQKTQEGARIIQGTAGHAVYEQATSRILLTAGVQATLTEAAKLQGPATLKSATATLYTDRSQRYEMAGDPAVNDIQFTPLRKSKAGGKEPGQPIAGAPVHLHNFRTGEIEQNRHIVVNGPESAVDISDPVENSVGNLVANRIAAEFSAGLDRAEASGDVHFRYERPGKKEGRQTLRGRSDTVAYTADQHRLVAAGDVEADLTDPAMLLEPAHLKAGKIVEYTQQPDKDAKGQEPHVIYELSGSAERNSLVFRPRPQEPKPNGARQPAPGVAPASTPLKTDAVQSFPLGIVHVTGFDSGTFEPGRSALLVGDKTVVHTEDKETRTTSTLHASRFAAKFAANQTLEQLTAQGNVRFALQEPARDQKAADGKPAPPRLATFTAVATRAILNATSQGQILTVPGPFRTSDDSGDPDEPYGFTGETNDTVTYNLTTGETNADSGNTPGTMVLIHPVRNKQTADAKKSNAPAAPPAKKRNR
jgi:lipopolysaccharide export system protein LptA